MALEQMEGFELAGRAVCYVLIRECELTSLLASSEHCP